MSDEWSQPELPIPNSGKAPFNLPHIRELASNDLEGESRQNLGDCQGLHFDMNGGGPIISNLQSFQPSTSSGAAPPCISPAWQSWPIHSHEEAANVNEILGAAAVTESQNSQFSSTNRNVMYVQGSASMDTTSTYMQSQTMPTMSAGNSDNVWGSFDPFPLAGNWASFPACYKPAYSFQPGRGYFYIDKAAFRNSVDGFRVMVFDPTGNSISADLEEENLLSSSRMVCSFEFSLPGIYTASVLLDSTGCVHASGSPLEFPANRNYALSQPMLTITFSEQLLKVWGVAYSRDSEKIYVTDRDADKVFIFNLDGSLYKYFGTSGCQPEEFRRPTGIAVDPVHKRLVITDKDNHRVCIYTLDGEFVRSFGSSTEAGFSYPWGVAVSPKDGTIAVADSSNHRVQLFSSEGVFIRAYSVVEDNGFKAKFHYPRGITFDPNGDSIILTDLSMRAIFQLDLNLTFLTSWIPKVELESPQGVAWDPVGNLLVCDTKSNSIHIFNPQREHITTLRANSNNSFSGPLDLSVLPNGQVVVVDSFSRVYVL